MAANHASTSPRTMKQQSSSPAGPEEAHLVNLPQELIMSNILTRLPAKSLYRFKSVCKSWCSFISEPYFRLQHQQQQQQKENKSLFILSVDPRYDHPLEHWGVLQLSAHDDDSQNHESSFTPMEWPRRGPSHESKMMEHHRILGIQHCNGFVLISTQTAATNPIVQKLYVWNPATRELFTLPDKADIRCIYNHHQKLDFSFGFGFDSSANKYKVLRYFCNAAAKYNYLEVFTLPGGSNNYLWHRIPEGPPFRIYPSSPPPLVGGTAYWKICQSMKTTTSANPVEAPAILGFSLEDYKYKVMTTFPPSFSGLSDFARDGFLTDLGGDRLCCYHGRCDVNNACIWTMDVHDCSWTLSYTIDLDSIDLYSLIGYDVKESFVPVAINHGKIYLVLNNYLLRWLICYDPQTRKAAVVSSIQGVEVTKFTSYVESMVPLGA